MNMRKHKIYVLCFSILVFIFIGRNILAQTSPTLSVTCSPNFPTGTTGIPVTWTATTTGGSTTRTYSWTGTDNLIGSAESVNWTYATEGIKTAQVSIASEGQSATANCTSVNIQPAPLLGYCSVISRINSDGSYILQYDSNILNTTATTTTWRWTGSDGLSGNKPGVVKNYLNGTSSLGLKQANLTINSGTQTLNFQCSADVHPVPTVPQSSSQNFSASCKPTVKGMSVHWDAFPYFSGIGTTTFSWTGTDGIGTTTAGFDKVYTTEGIKSATVVVSSGTQSMTLQCQAKVASTTGSGSSNCFIATAVFGTSLEPEVMVLRNFRDDTLNQSITGRLAVKAYYAVSPPIAEFIRKRETAKKIVRAGLEPLVYSLEKLGYKN